MANQVTGELDSSQIRIQQLPNVSRPTAVEMEDQESKRDAFNQADYVRKEYSGEERGSPEPEPGGDEILISVYIGDIPFRPHSKAEDEGSLHILIHEDATLEDLKLEIQKRYHGLEPYFQVLLFRGDIMTDDERKLSEYGIDEDDTELELETAKICEECGGRVYRIGEYGSEQCGNCDQRCEDCDEKLEADEGA